MLQDEPIIKSMGFALAVAVVFDAFVVRMALIPALMYLLGEKAWWLPTWLDRLLPNVDVEGESLERPPGLAHEVHQRRISVIRTTKSVEQEQQSPSTDDRLVLEHERGEHRGSGSPTAATTRALLGTRRRRTPRGEARAGSGSPGRPGSPSPAEGPPIRKSA